ncbi:KRBBA protein, partial [Rhagologus leucostigma]|nr:KRBBA protein [Rhagologus leucostigma]
SASPLLLPPSQEFLHETLKKPSRYFWIGLGVPAAGTGWTWVNGSLLDRDRFQPDLGERPGLCGMIRGSTIIPDTCDLASQWICQREATK